VDERGEGGRNKELQGIAREPLTGSLFALARLPIFPLSSLPLLPPFRWITTVLHEDGVEYCDGVHNQTELVEGGR
jgi:hypothetical protein